ncbi:MAG: hypothetical protein MUF48_08470, partial [Pirellulaceae bacterium]|nr:hypothetical protein [Pirellulaceae bacterium]
MPIEVSFFDDGGQVTDQMAVDPARAARSLGVPTGLSAGTDQTHYLRWMRQTDDPVTGELVAVRVDQDISSSGDRTQDTSLRRDHLRVRCPRPPRPGSHTRRHDHPQRVRRAGANLTKVVENDTKGRRHQGRGSRRHRLTRKPIRPAARASARSIILHILSILSARARHVCHRRLWRPRPDAGVVEALGLGRRAWWWPHVADDLLPPGDKHRGAVVPVADDLLPPGDKEIISLLSACSGVVYRKEVTFVLSAFSHT